MQKQLLLQSVRRLACMALVGLSVNLSQACATTVRQLVEVVDIGNLSVSPNGRLVAFRTEQASIERNTYETVWYVQPADGSALARRMGEGGETLRDTGGYARREPARWSPDGRWIYYRAALAGRIDIWRAAVDGSRTEQLTHDPANVRDFALSTDGRLVLYSTGAAREDAVSAEQDEYDRGIHLDGTVPLADSLFRSGYHEGRLSTQRLVEDGEYFPLLSDQPDRWMQLDIARGTATLLGAPVHPGDSPAASDLRVEGGEVEQVAAEPHGKRIAILLRPDEGVGAAASQVQLAVLADARSRRPVFCRAEACLGKNITSVIWRPESEEVLFTVTSRERALAQSILRWNVASGAVSEVVRSGGMLSGGNRLDPGPCAISALAMVCVSAQADRPPRLERINLDVGTRSVLFDPNQGLAQDMRKTAQVRVLSWADAQGTDYTGQFYPALGRSGKAPPLFIAYYRCAGFLRGGLGDEWPLVVLAQHGIAALCVNASPYIDDAVVRYDQSIGAIRKIVKELGQQGEVDPKRVGLGGLSFGAEVSMWAAMYSDIPKAISISTPVASPAVMTMLGLWEGDNAARMQRFWQVGTPEQTPGRWQQLSPAYAPSRIKVPVLMQMSEQEYRISLDYAVPMIRDGQADAYVFPNEPHQKFQPRHKLAVYERNLDWFRYWLLGQEDDDPVKASQYTVWRGMKGDPAVTGTP